VKFEEKAKKFVFPRFYKWIHVFENDEEDMRLYNRVKDGVCIKEKENLFLV